MQPSVHCIIAVQRGIPEGTQDGDKQAACCHAMATAAALEVHPEGTQDGENGSLSSLPSVLAPCCQAHAMWNKERGRKGETGTEQEHTETLRSQLCAA